MRKGGLQLLRKNKKTVATLLAAKMDEKAELTA